ncbi:YihY/virulence factor BrkB family protein [Acuticoccus sp. MNP-M23]|uniref:YihY/virulence factor BrkB family protein n=1 Tax=Acuticoccus sp. MNP-M23 TaxID=3072793 RepID=UPI0028168217|nr:YihY/virulence factor BrkB family protein [Acuticoccus sp. MNP-M23]WMS41235.1 YihY/virulence factor BrkB family protein [Acuticoccus sp. MNP-M23]
MDDDGTGRYAERITQIPLGGWKAILKRTYTQIGEDNLTLIAGGSTFFLLLAVFPALASFVALYGLFFDTSDIAKQVEEMRGVVPASGLELIEGELTRLVAQPAATLGVGFAISLLVSLWSANAGMRTLFTAMNIAYGEEEKRGFFSRTLLSLSFTLMSIVAVAVLFLVIGGVPVLVDALPFSKGTETLVLLLRWPLLLLFVVVGLSVLYKYGPSRRPPRWRWLGWGTTLTALLWLGVSAAFAFYLSRFADYNATYGSLGAVVGFMMWLYVSLVVVLLGAELNAEIEHQVATDTTTGPYKPMGERGAHKADRLPDAA